MLEHMSVFLMLWLIGVSIQQLDPNDDLIHCVRKSYLAGKALGIFRLTDGVNTAYVKLDN